MNYKNYCLFSIILMLSITVSSFASEEKSHSRCYEQIDSLLSYNDKISVTINNGTEFTGALKKVTPDSIMIRYKPIKFVQSGVSQIIMIEDISKIKFNGMREKNYFLPEGYIRALSFGVGILINTQIVENSNDEDQGLKKAVFGIGFGLLLGEVLSKITIKKIPVDITFQCK